MSIYCVWLITKAARMPRHKDNNRKAMLILSDPFVSVSFHTRNVTIIFTKSFPLELMELLVLGVARGAMTNEIGSTLENPKPTPLGYRYPLVYAYRLLCLDYN